MLLSFRKFSFILLFILGLTSCGEIFIVTGCVVTPIAEALTPSTKLDLAPAQLQQVYSSKVEVNRNVGLNFAISQSNLPQGLSAKLLEQTTEDTWHVYTGRAPGAYNNTIWLEVTGTPEKAGNYKVQIEQRSMPTMCGSSKSQFTVRLQVNKAE